MAAKEEAEEEQGGIETKIEAALRSRLQHFKQNADSFTLERVRRLIEKDLELEKFALDVHKRFIKQSLEKQMENADDDGAPEDSKEKLEKDASSTKQEKEVAESPKRQVIEKDIKEATVVDEAQLEDSPIMGVMSSKSESADAQGGKASESTIKKAIWERAAHFRANSESITLAGVRRLLEEDLGLEKNTLDAFKKFIHNQIDEVLASSEALKSTSSGTESPERRSKTAKKSGVKSDSFSSRNKNVAAKGKLGKSSAAKEKAEKSEGLKKRKRPNLDDNVPAKKRIEVSSKLSDENSDGDTNKSDAEDVQSGSSTEVPAKKKVVGGASAATGYGKRVDKLKSIIKACGMSVAPSVYKRAKQVSDDKREGFLIEELKKILSSEGISTNPTEKEIKEVKRRKERAKELEGIDLSNIVTNSRRRSTTGFVPPPRPKSPPKDDKNDEKNGDSNNDDVSDDSKDDDDNEDDSSQSEEFNEDGNEDSE